MNNIRRKFKTGGFFRLTQIFSSLRCHIPIFLMRHSVTETLCMKTFCRGDVLCGDVLYARQKLLNCYTITILLYTEYS
jgi:hypothetical protein